MFEYMAAGLPFIASDFPVWKKIVDESKAGICVNPYDIKALQESINYLINNRTKAQQMGLNGRKYVVEKCSWANEEILLRSLYEDLCFNNYDNKTDIINDSYLKNNS